MTASAEKINTQKTDISESNAIARNALTRFEQQQPSSNSKNTVLELIILNARIEVNKTNIRTIEENLAFMKSECDLGQANLEAVASISRHMNQERLSLESFDKRLFAIVEAATTE